MILDLRELVRRASSNESLKKLLGLLVVKQYVIRAFLNFRAFENEHTLMHVVEDTSVLRV